MNAAPDQAAAAGVAFAVEPDVALVGDGVVVAVADWAAAACWAARMAFSVVDIVDSVVFMLVMP